MESSYYDDLGLIQCWQAALSDYKFAHIHRFPPIQTRLSQKEKEDTAPLWYQPIPKLKTKKKKNKKRGAAQDIDSCKRARLSSPIYTPQSPKYAPKSPVYSPVNMPVSPQYQPSESPLNLEQLEATDLPSPEAAKDVISTIAHNHRLPRAYPTPPPIPVLEDKVKEQVTNRANGGSSDQERLETALWAWYNAGYQTALYHVKMGEA